MQIRYIYHYIYLPAAPRAPRSIGGGSDAVEMNRRLNDLIEMCRDDAMKARLEELQKVCNRILGIVGNIPSNGIRRMLMGKVEEIMNMAAKGDMAGAEALAEKTVNLAEQCREMCYHIQNNINALANPTYVQGKAAALCKAIANAAADAMDKAGSLGELQEISDLTDRAVEIMRNLKSLDPKSKDYADWCRELVGILGALAAKAQGGEDQGPGMEQDSIAWQHEEAGRVRDRVDQLRGKTTDAFDLQNLDRLDDAFAGILEQTKGMPDEQARAAGKQIEELLKKAADGDIQGALREAKLLEEKLGRTNKLRGFAEKRLGHLEKAAEGLTGPAGDAAARVLDKLKKARDKADSPEAVEALDKQIEAAQVAVAALKEAPAGSHVRHPAYRQLLGLERELGPSDKAEKADGEGRPGVGRDTFGRGTGPIKNAGTKPLPENPFADLPKGDALGRVGAEIRGLEALAKGIADPSDREAVMGVAARVQKAVKGAKSGMELAMIALELQQVTKAAKGLRNGDDQAANRYACDRAFQAEGYAGEGSALDGITLPDSPLEAIIPPPPTTDVRGRSSDRAEIEPPRVRPKGTDVLRGPVEIPKPPAKAGASEGLTPPPDAVQDPVNVAAEQFAKDTIALSNAAS